MATDDLRALLERLTEQHEWLRQRWRARGGDQHVVVHLLRLWVEGRAVVEELARRSPSARGEALDR